VSGPKTLLPELLPAPRPEAEVTPRQRVAERARLLLERFRGLGTVAGAAVLGIHCGGYAVVDMLPPPAQQCSASPDPFSLLFFNASFDVSAAAPLPPVVINIGSYNTTGFRVDDVRVTGGMLVSIAPVNGPGPSGGALFRVVVAPETATSVLLVDIDIGCGTAKTTRHYRIAYHIPVSSGDVLVLEEVHDG
jgi:hypothetical protein